MIFPAPPASSGSVTEAADALPAAPNLSKLKGGKVFKTDICAAALDDASSTGAPTWSIGDRPTLSMREEGRIFVVMTVAPLISVGVSLADFPLTAPCEFNFTLSGNSFWT